MTLERLLHGRYQRDETANNPPARSLNINDIYQHLQEFTDPIVPPRPPQQEAMEVEHPPQNTSSAQQPEVPPAAEIERPALSVHSNPLEPNQPEP
jgi:hypothetical protein